MSDNIVVMFEGKITGTLSGDGRSTGRDHAICGERRMKEEEQWKSGERNTKTLLDIYSKYGIILILILSWPS